MFRIADRNSLLRRAQMHLRLDSGKISDTRAIRSRIRQCACGIQENQDFAFLPQLLKICQFFFRRMKTVAEHVNLVISGIQVLPEDRIERSAGVEKLLRRKTDQPVSEFIRIDGIRMIRHAVEIADVGDLASAGGIGARLHDLHQAGKQRKMTHDPG